MSRGAEHETNHELIKQRLSRNNSVSLRTEPQTRNRSSVSITDAQANKENIDTQNCQQPSIKEEYKRRQTTLREHKQTGQQVVLRVPMVLVSTASLRTLVSCVQKILADERLSGSLLPVFKHKLKQAVATIDKSMQQPVVSQHRQIQTYFDYGLKQKALLQSQIEKVVRKLEESKAKRNNLQLENKELRCLVADLQAKQIQPTKPKGCKRRHVSDLQGDDEQKKKLRQMVLNQSQLILQQQKALQQTQMQHNQDAEDLRRCLLLQAKALEKHKQK